MRPRVLVQPEVPSRYSTQAFRAQVSRMQQPVPFHKHAHQLQVDLLGAQAILLVTNSRANLDRKCQIWPAACCGKHYGWPLKGRQ